MARSRDPRREHFWRQHHLRQHSSGLSISEYCTRECISAAAFYAWRKRLAPTLPALPEPPLFLPVHLASHALVRRHSRQPCESRSSFQATSAFAWTLCPSPNGFVASPPD